MRVITSQGVSLRAVTERKVTPLFTVLKDRVRSFGSRRRPAINVHDHILALLVFGASVQPRKTLRHNILKCVIFL